MSYPERNFRTRERVHPLYWTAAVAVVFYAVLAAILLAGRA